MTTHCGDTLSHYAVPMKTKCPAMCNTVSLIMVEVYTDSNSCSSSSNSNSNSKEEYAWYSYKFCLHFKHLFRCKYKIYRYKIFKKLKKYFKKDISTIVTQNYRLLLVHCTTNLWVNNRLIHKSWPGVSFYTFTTAAFSESRF